MVLSLLYILFVPNFAFAGEVSFAQQGKTGIYIWAKSDVSTLTAGKKLELFSKVEKNLVDQLRNDLQDRGLFANIVESEQEIIKNENRYVLIIKLENVNLGFRGPFGRISTVKASYIFQKGNKSEIISNYYEETSHKRWQNCTKKICEQIVQNVATAINNTTVDSNKIKNVTAQSKQDLSEKSVDTRLQQLENLKSKGLITSEEYEAKRKEIIKEL